MAKINVLDISVANMIAAGEVVERPSSVVKELVENSIDAGAKNITVEIKNGGMSYIRVTDDGCGIEKDDVKTAFLPHATSKIKTSDDLSRIYTLGFRGEALSSIASVAKVEIYTKTKDSLAGRRLLIEGGKVLEEEDAGCAVGTTIIVRNLFYNTPARQKFLKKDATEASYVSDVINKIILGNPSVSIKYIGTSNKISSLGDGDLKNAIYAVYGKDYLKHLLPVDFSDENIEVTGFIGNSSLAKKNRNYQVFFLNGRNIQSKTMSVALSEAFKNTLMTGQFPFAVLFVKVNSTFVDVNVHPTKMEVRFSDDKKVFDALYWAAKNALNEKKHIPEMKIEKPKIVFENRVKNVKQTEINFLKDAFIKSPKADEAPKKMTISDIIPKKESKYISDAVDTFKKEYKEQSQKEIIKEEAGVKPKIEEKTVEPIKEIVLEEKTVETTAYKNEEPAKKVYQPNIDYKIAGQIFSTYIIVEMGDEMHIIDQHAAHERLYFEQFLKDLNENKVYSQPMLIPVTVDLTPIEFDLVMQNVEFFSKVGFELEEFGANVIIIRSVPETLVDASISDIFHDVLKILSENNGKLHTDAELEMLHTMACKRAIKGNHVLSKQEMEKLVSDVFSLENINTCPHGRPIEIKMTKKELEKNFKRIV
ncbi:MAG: DNA mismatch repair endonuclease MutL [Ruminococcaceae bacterium]|nr:DNA mismatch repair endonuclease MutL [Oscillospiraceae bacterium]